jgi:hypothetical protein
MKIFRNFKKQPFGLKVLIFLALITPLVLWVELIVIEFLDNKTVEISVYDPDPVILQDGSNTVPAPVPYNEGEKEAEKYRQEAVKRQISQSPYSESVKSDGKPDCENIFKDYELEILNSVKQKKLSDKLKETTNDVLLQSCIRDPRFQKRYDELQDMLAEALE